MPIILFEKRNIKIAEEDIEQTFLNLLKNMNFNNSENLIKNLHSYNIDKNYLYSQLENEIIKEVVKQILLKQINKNLIDEIYKKKTSKTKTFFSLNNKVAGENFKSIINKIRNILKSNKADYLFVSAPENVAWTLNIR